MVLFKPHSTWYGFYQGKNVFKCCLFLSSSPSSNFFLTIVHNFYLHYVYLQRHKNHLSGPVNLNIAHILFTMLILGPSFFYYPQCLQLPMKVLFPLHHSSSDCQLQLCHVLGANKLLAEKISQHGSFKSHGSE